jgi:hypothetical protein
MMGIAEEPPRQLAPSVENATLDFVIWARSVKFVIVNNMYADQLQRSCKTKFVGSKLAWAKNIAYAGRTWRLHWRLRSRMV